MSSTRKSRWIAATAVLAAAALSVSGTPAARAQTSGVQTVFTPTYAAGYANPGVMYARPVTLHHHGDANGTILTTFEVYTGTTPPVFPVYESTNGGTGWTKVGQVTDTVNGYGMRWNPQIYELPAALSSLPAGTILISGESVPADLHSIEILLYASTDRGRTWRLLSSVAKGGRAVPGGSNTPVWEPFLLMSAGKLIVYYSDERDKANHSQKLVHQVTTDGVHWGPIVDDVAYPTQSARPGMATVAQISGGRWIMTYEYCGAPSGGCPVHYKIATNPENFNAATGQQIVLDDGTTPCCQPYVVWTPSGGPDGTIVVSAGGQTALAVNTAGGTVNTWRSEASNAPGGYGRALMVRPDGNTVMTLTGGYHDSNFLNQVQYAFDHVAPGLSVGATYTLTNSYSGLNLAITSTADGAPVVQLTPSSAADQQWALTRQANGYFTLRNVASGRVLAVTGASTSDGATVELRSPSSSSAAQEWAVVQQSDGSFTVVNRKSDLLLDDYQRSTTSGSRVVQWTANGGANQRWTLTHTALPSLTTGEFTIQNNLGKYLEIPAGSTVDGTQADQWWYANQSWHLWRLVAASGGYRIINGRSGLALTDTYPASGERITQATVDNSNTKQVWTLVPQGNQFLIRNAGTGRVVTIAQGSSADLAKAVSWTVIGTPDQSWTLRRIN